MQLQIFLRWFQAPGQLHELGKDCVFFSRECRAAWAYYAVALLAA